MMKWTHMQHPLALLISACISQPLMAQPHASPTTSNANGQNSRNAIHIIDQPQRIEVPGALPTHSLIHQGCKAHNLTQINTIQDALSCLDGVAIGQQGSVTIALRQAPNFLYQTIAVNHPNGDQIAISGECGQAPCDITFAKNQSGVLIANHHSLGLLSQLSLHGQVDLENTVNLTTNVHSTMNTDTQANGIELRNQALLVAGQQLTIQGFFEGLLLSQQSSAQVKQVVTLHNYGGVLVTMNSTLTGEDFSSHHNDHDGFYVDRNSYMKLGGQISSQNNGRYAVVSQLHSIFECTHRGDEHCDIENHIQWSDSWFYRWD